jgi:transposase
VQIGRVWARLFGVEHTVVEAVRFDEQADSIVASVRPARGRRRRCGICGRPSPGFDQGEGRRRWRALDLGTVQALLEADAPRVRCRQHGVVVAAVPWARHGAGFTRGFEDTAAWLAVHTSQAAVAELLRVAWPTVGRILTRVAEEADQGVDPLEGLRGIGIDEVSHRKGHRYLTVVSTRTAAGWSGQRPATTRPGCTASSTPWASSARASSAWSARMRPPGSPTRSHSVAPGRAVPGPLPRRLLGHRRAGRGPPPDLERRPPRRPAGTARELKGARFGLWKNPEHLTVRQRGTLARVADVNRRLYRAYLLKEELRLVFKLKGMRAVALLDAWLWWARRCRIPAFVKLARSITEHRAGIQASLLYGLSNGLVESVNTKLRLLTRIAFGFHSPDALISLAMLALGGLCPPLPGRA